MAAVAKADAGAPVAVGATAGPVAQPAATGGRPLVSAASALATATLAKIRAGVSLPKGGLAQLSALSRAAAAPTVPSAAAPGRGVLAAAPAAAPLPAGGAGRGSGADDDDDAEPSNLFV